MQWYKYDDNSLSVDSSCDDINGVNVYTLILVMKCAIYRCLTLWYSGQTIIAWYSSSNTSMFRARQ